MTDAELQALRYPIGKADLRALLSPAERQERIETLRQLPALLRETSARLSEAQLDQPYRPGGWTLRQVLHHVPDSHLNAYIRFKWALTEEQPLIKAYDEEAWAELPDSRGPVSVSLGLLESLHARWVSLIEAMTPEQFQRSIVHPERGPMNLDQMLCLYAWHSMHHLAHLRLGLK